MIISLFAFVVSDVARKETDKSEIWVSNGRDWRSVHSLLECNTV